MAYASTVASVRQIVDQGLYAVQSEGAVLGGGGSIFAYCSSHAAATIVAAGFFAQCGAQPTSGNAAMPLVKSADNRGMRFGDLVVNIQSSAGAAPGTVSWHSVTGSTYNQASSAASSGHSSLTAGFDITVV